MKQSVYVMIIYSLFAFLDYHNLFIIYEKYLLFEKKKAKKGDCFWFVYMLAVSLPFGLSGMKVIDSKLLYSVLYLPFYLKALPLLWTCFSKRIKDVPIILIYNAIISTISQNIYPCLFDRFENTVFDEFTYSIIELFTAFFIALVLSIGLYFRRKNILRIYFGELTLLQYVAIFLAVYFAGFVQASIIVNYSGDKLLYVISLINILVVFFLAGQLMLIKESDVRKDRTIDIIDDQIKSVTQHYYEEVEADTQLRKFRHDTKNLLSVLYSLVENNENSRALEYIEKMKTMSIRTERVFNTGSFIADSILDSKAVIAETIDTSILFSGNVPNILEDVDLVILLANAIDNALESCKRIAGKKIIEIDSIRQSDMFVLTIKNPAVLANAMHESIPNATKKDKRYHGFGIPNMERVVQKYNGQLMFESDDGYFYTKMIMNVD